MRARALPGAAALGLLASFLAHAAAFRDGHAMGGSYHDALLGTACFTALCGLTIAVAVAWASAGRTLEGSIIAARLRSGVPSWYLVAFAAGGWLALAEHVEPHHEAVSPFILAAAIAAAAWLLLLLARALIAFISAIVVAVCADLFAPRANVARISHRTASPLRAMRLRAYRRYARPPPVVVAGA